MTAVIAAAGSLVLAAVVVGWPVRAARHRGRRLLAGAPAPHRQRWWALSRWGAGPLLSALRRSPLTGWIALAAAVAIGIRLGGPVVGSACAGYGTVARLTLRHRQRRRAATRARVELLDALDAAAAELRAGLPANIVLASLEPASAAPDRVPAERPGPSGARSPSGNPAGVKDPLRATVAAAAALADRTGAPLAPVLERIELDARRTDRTQAAVAAQAAGAQATAGLLALLPVAGLALGYAIGADPLAVLLHTPVGTICGLGALALQLAGLAWCRRLIRPVVHS